MRRVLPAAALPGSGSLAATAELIADGSFAAEPRGFASDRTPASVQGRSTFDIASDPLAAA